MATLSLRNVSKDFGDTKVLNDIELQIADRDFVVFVGPSGCGKTTLLRIIAGLEEATTGHVEIEGRDVTHEHPLSRGIAMVFQSYALYPHLTVFENIAFPLRVSKASEDEVKQKVAEAAEILHLTDRLGFKPGQLSGGQRQRVAIGRAIVRKPKVFLFDEPLSNLDAALRGAMRVELSRLHQQLSTTMIYVTHDQVEAMTMADRIVVLSDGKLMQYGSPMELFHHPANRFVAGFIGNPKMNFLSGKCAKVTDGKAEVTIPGMGTFEMAVETVGLEAGMEVELGMRPDDFALGEGSLKLRMNVQVIERLGNGTMAYGNLDGDHDFSVFLTGDAPVWENEAVDLSINPDSCHLFKPDGGACLRKNAPEVLVNKAKT